MPSSITAAGVVFPDATVQTTAAGAGGSSLEAVASGSLSDGSTVVVNSDGTVSVVAGVAYTEGSTNLTATNFIGISDGAYTNGQTATVQLLGSVDDAQSGLTAGQKYYVTKSGTLSLTPDTPSVLAGTAVSATELIIKR